MLRALLLLAAAPLARAGTVVGHGYITNTNEATGDVSVSLTGIASQTANFITVVDDAAGAIFSVAANGDVTSATGNYATSDARWKANVTALGYGLDALMALRPVEFHWNAQAPARAVRSKQLGFIAQEVEAVAPEIVNTDASGYKSMMCGEFETTPPRATATATSFLPAPPRSAPPSGLAASVGLFEARPCAPLPFPPRRLLLRP